MNIPRRKQQLLAGLAAASCGLVGSAQAALTWTAEPVGATTSSRSCTLVETFDSGAPSTVIGTYSGAYISGADVFGGDNGTNYLDLDGANNSTAVTLNLNQTESYFGMWWSADSGGNTITFFNDAVQVGQFTDSIFDSLGDAYKSHPQIGGNTNEKYAFINFEGMDFNRIEFAQNSGGGFESDNHTVLRQCVPDGGSLFGVFSLVIGSLFWARRKVQS